MDAAPAFRSAPPELPPTTQADGVIGARSGFVRWLLLGNALAIAIIATLAAITLIDSRSAHQQRATLSAQNSARTMALAVGGKVDRIDLLLRAVILGIERERRDGADDPVAVQRILETRRVLLPELQVLRTTDANGIVRFGADVAGGPLVDVSDRDYFIRARDDPRLELVVSEPIIGRTSKRWVVAFARRLNADDGSFLGIVYASVAADHFQDILSSADLGTQGAISLRNKNLQLVARATKAAAPSAAGIGSRNVSEELRHAVLAQPAGGVFGAVTAIDQVERANAFSPVHEYPLYVIAGLGMSEFMAPWRQQVVQVSALALAVSLILAGSSWLLVRARRREMDSISRLAREARRNQALLRTASDGIHVLDREGCLVELSDSFASMLGRTREQMLGRSVSDWEATASAEYAAHWCRQANGQSSFATRHRRADDSLIDVEITSTTIAIDGADLIYCSARDVTERRRLEREAARNLERAQRSEERVRDIADNVPASIIYVDRHQRLQFANAAFSRMLGKPVAALVGQPLSEVFSAGYAERAAAIAAVLEGTPVVFNQTVELGGRIHHTESTLSPKRDGNGQVEGFYSLTQDLTQRVMLEQALALQTRNLAAMTAVSGDISLVMDPQGRILGANRAFEDHWELPTGGAAGRTLQEIYGPDFFHDVVEPRVKRVLDGETVRLRTLHELRGRGLRACDITYEGVRNERGEIDAVVFTSHDVNDLVQAVEQLQHTNESLEQFARITSHDMREPLNTIVQFVGLIESQHHDTLAPPLDVYLAFVKRGALRMKAMLDDLLRFVRLEADGEGANERVDLGPLMREIEAALAVQVSASQGRLSIDPLPAVCGQRALLSLLFQNLVSNALKFCHPGVAPQVAVTARREGGRVIVSVEDRGIGIAAEDIPKLFEPFRRLHRRQLYEGTGLGLATCKRVMLALGGHIEISSQLGAWTRVSVTLPAG
jgi:PAS domain S-box-containing protein